MSWNEFVEWQGFRAARAYLAEQAERDGGGSSDE